MTVNGEVFELPTWEPAIAGIESSSLLLTPVASEGEKATFQQGSAQRALTGQPFLTNQIRAVYDLNARMLPTPTSSDTNGAGKHGDGGLDLRTAVSLLPTPKASDGEKGGPNQRGSSGDWPLPAIAHLLPTPTVGMMMGGSETRSGARNGEKLLPGVAKDLALLRTPCAAEAAGGPRNPNRPGATMRLSDQIREQQIGATTNPPSDAGRLDSDGQLLGQQNLLDAMEDIA